MTPNGGITKRIDRTRGSRSFFPRKRSLAFSEDAVAFDQKSILRGEEGPSVGEHGPVIIPNCKVNPWRIVWEKPIKQGETQL
jgi:hypothetical protein